MVGAARFACGRDYRHEGTTMYRNALARAQGAKKTITREAHSAVLELHQGGLPKDRLHWHYDLRRGRLCIYGGLLRFIDACILAGKPDIARKVVGWLAWYVEEQAGPARPVGLKKVA